MSVSESGPTTSITIGIGQDAALPTQTPRCSIRQGLTQLRLPEVLLVTDLSGLFGPNNVG